MISLKSNDFDDLVQDVEPLAGTVQLTIVNNFHFDWNPTNFNAKRALYSTISVANLTAQIYVVLQRKYVCKLLLIMMSARKN